MCTFLIIVIISLKIEIKLFYKLVIMLGYSKFLILTNKLMQFLILVVKRTVID